MDKRPAKPVDALQVKQMMDEFESKQSRYTKGQRGISRLLNIDCEICGGKIQRCRTCERLFPQYHPEYQQSLTAAAGFCSSRCERAADLNVTLSQLENNENGIVQLPPPPEWELDKIKEEYEKDRISKGLKI